MKAWREVLAWGLVALGSLASPAAADEPRDDRVVVALRYEPHEGCPDADAFRRGVEARTSKVRWSEEGERRFRVVLTRREGLTHGQLEMSDADRAPSRPREVSDRGCEAVVDALALVAALAVDPMASYAPRPEPPEPPDENPPPKPSPDPEPGLGA
ncbi:MAG: hypothetical protein KC731_18520, partial [Myxococcales bacterium]|nr:hypothetical protein [Myxococcales bacterium]